MPINATIEHQDNTLREREEERERDVTKNRERGERKSCEIVKDDFHTSTLFSVFS